MVDGSRMVDTRYKHRVARHSERWSSLWTALEEHVWNTGCPKVFQEIKADTQFAEMFVEQLGSDNATLVDVPLGFDCNHFGYGRELHKATKEELHD